MARRPRDRSFRVVLTQRGWAFLAAAVLAFGFAYGAGFAELLSVAVLLAAVPAAGLVMVWAGRPRLSVDRTFTPHILEAGKAAHVALGLRNLSTRPTRRAQWWDGLPWGTGRTDPAELPSLRPRGARYATRGNAIALGYELRPPRRGIFAIGPLGVELADPFGMARSWLVAGEPQQIVVTPEVVALGDTGLSASLGDGEARLVQRKAGGDEDDTMTREYRSGDAMRRVHWRASARHGDLMVRQEEQRSLPEARVIIDTRRDSYRDAYGETADDSSESAAFEWSVRMLASVTVHLRRAGFVVSIDETAPPQLPPLSQRRQRTWNDEEFLAGLAALQLSAIATVPAGDTRSSGPVVAIIGAPDDGTLHWLARQRRAGELGIVFIVRAVSAMETLDRSFQMPVAATVSEFLTDAGWIVVPVRDDDDHAAAWEAVVVESGRARTGA